MTIEIYKNNKLFKDENKYYACLESIILRFFPF